jgi:HPt (histidine-containing phosphotransfer) domain-containing protein
VTTRARETSLRALWEQHRPEMLAKVGLIERAIVALAASELDRRLRREAQRSAHTLSGSLGVFGFAHASQAAHELELELAVAEPERAPALSALAAAVRDGVEAQAFAGTLTAGGPQAPQA